MRSRILGLAGVGLLVAGLGVGCGGGSGTGKSLTEDLKDRAADASNKASEGIGSVNREELAKKVEDAADKAAKAVAGAGKAAAEKLDQFSEKVRDEYVADAKKKLAELDVQLGELKERIARAGADAKPKLQEQYDKLAAQRQVLAPKLDALQNAGAKSWAELRQSFSQSWDEFSKGLKEASDGK